MINKFAENLKALRLDKNLKQSKLAAMLGTTQRRISHLESGKIEPDLETLWLLADIFEVTVDYLIGKTNY